MTWPRWAVMWTLAAAIYAGCKGLTWYRTPVPSARFWRHAAYLLAWPGLDAAAFLGSPAAPAIAPPSAFEWWFALAKLAFGAGTGRSRQPVSASSGDAVGTWRSAT